MNAQPELPQPWQEPYEEKQGNIADTVKAMIGALRRRYRLLLGVTVLIFALAVVAVMLVTPRYQATTRMKIDPSQGAALGQVSQSTTLPDQSIVETEVSVMRSRDIAVGVARKLNLIADSEFNGGTHLPATTDPAELQKREATVVDHLLAALTVDREKLTYVVDIGFRSTNPAKAALIANTFATQYIDSSVGSRTGTAERQSQYLEKRLAALNSEAQAADMKLAQYRSQTGTVDSGGATVTDQQISPLAGQLATAESEAAAARSNLEIAKRQIASGGLNSVSAVLSSQVIGNLRAQRAQLGTTLGDIQTRYGPKHPETVKINQQIQAIDQQIKDEATRVIGGLESEANSAAARAASLRVNLGQLRGRQAQETQASIMATGFQRSAEAAHTAQNQLAGNLQQTDQVARNSLSQAQIVEAATAPKNPTEPNKRLLLAAGALLALLSGTAAAGAAELMTMGLRTSADVERMRLPFIASIPKMSRRQMRDDSGQPPSPANTLVAHPMTSYAESFRAIRSTLSRAGDSPPRVIALASVLPDEGKSTSALSLARMMAISGEKVLLIDTDLRRAGLSKLSHTSTAVGLVEVLRDGADPRLAISSDTIPNLDILPVAEASFVAIDLFSGPAMSELIEEMLRIYDRIVFDTPPLLGVADARAVAVLADAVLLVIKWDATSRNAVKAGLSWLELDQAKVAGAVLSMVDPAAEAVGALYYSRKYAYYYQSN